MSGKSHSLYRILQGVSLIAAPVLGAAATFFWDEAGRYSAVAGTLIALGSVFWIHGLIALFDAIRVRLPVYAAIGLPVAVYGCFGGINFGLQGFYESVFGVSKQASLDALAAHPLAANLLLWWPGPLFPLSMFVLGIVLAWTRLAPRWNGVLVCVAAIAFPASRIPRIEWVAHIVDVLLLVPFAYLGWLVIAGGLRPARREPEPT